MGKSKFLVAGQCAKGEFENQRLQQGQSYLSIGKPESADSLTFMLCIFRLRKFAFYYKNSVD